ncbi:MAG: ribosome maturation factor RimP [Pseudomonadota bacterium]|nr:ribosome maturation factor RimP [Pseudomonadota bacterium]
MDKAQHIAELLTPTIASMGLELLGIDYLSNPGSAVLRLYIDVPANADEGRHVGIEDCEAVSREVSAQLDVEDPISSNYTLEVSSPGLDRPLFTLPQFARFIGETAKVTMKLPQDGRRRLQGVIIRVDDASVVFNVDHTTDNSSDIEINFDNIEKAKLVPDWAALGFAADKPKPGHAPRKSGQPQFNKKPHNNKPTARKPSSAE